MLDESIDIYFIMAASNQRVRERYGDAVLDIPAHETVLRPRETLQRLCDHLQVTCFEGYFKKCSEILYGAPSGFGHQKQSSLDQRAETARHKNDEEIPFSKRVFIC